MAKAVLHYGIQPSEFLALTRHQKQALRDAAEEINQRK